MAAYSVGSAPISSRLGDRRLASAITNRLRADRRSATAGSSRRTRGARRAPGRVSPAAASAPLQLERTAGWRAWTGRRRPTAVAAALLRSSRSMRPRGCSAGGHRDDAVGERAAAAARSARSGRGGWCRTASRSRRRCAARERHHAGVVDRAGRAGRSRRAAKARTEDRSARSSARNSVAPAMLAGGGPAPCLVAHGQHDAGAGAGQTRVRWRARGRCWRR